VERKNSGALLVQTFNGGTILIAPDGSMRMAPCRNGAR
jgi:hypothetical protein